MIINDEIFPDCFGKYDSIAEVALPEETEGDHISTLEVTFFVTPPSQLYRETFKIAAVELLRGRLNFDSETTVNIYYEDPSSGTSAGTVKIDYWLKPGYRPLPLITERGINMGLGR